MDTSIPFKYCQDTLEPIGLVTYAVIDEQLNSWGYAKTAYGQDQGVPLAGLLLEFSRQDPNHSLSDYFGKTASTAKTDQEEGQTEGDKKRAPATRLRLFRELVTSDLPVRQIDLVQRIGEYHVLLSHHLKSLKERRVISYESTEQGEPFSIYGFESDHPPTVVPAYRSNRRLTNDLWQILAQNPQRTYTIEEMAGVYLEANPHALDFNMDYLRPRISGVLNHLHKRGFASRQKFSCYYKSAITLSDGQRAKIGKLVGLIDGFQNQKPEIMALGRQMADYFMANPTETTRLMAKAREHSSHANQRDATQTKEAVIYYLTASPQSTAKKIRQGLQNEDISLSDRRIGQLLLELLRSGEIVATVQKGIKYYSLRSRPAAKGARQKEGKSGKRLVAEREAEY